MGHTVKRKFGRILLDGRFLSPKDLENALKEQQATKELLGQVLVRMGVLAAEDILGPLLVQEHLGDLRDAVQLAAGDRQLLGELLVQSGHISGWQLDCAIEEQQRSGDKIGEVFKRLGMLTEGQLNALLDFQHTQEIAHTSPLRLGNLLVATGHISQQQLDNALRQQTLSHKKLGEVLVDEGYVRPGLIAYGVRLQKMLVKAVLAGILSLGMSSESHASTVGLQWDRNTEPAVSGYKVYYSEASSSFAGSMPIDVHNQTTATISGLDPGKAYKFAVTAYDSAGRESPLSNIVTVAELSPPTVTIVSPENATSVSGVVSIRASAVDNIGVAKVEFYINGQLRSTATAAPYVYSWDTTAYPPGVYTLLAKAYDTAGNVSQTSNTVINSVQETNTPTLQAAYNDAVAGNGVVRLTAADAIPASSAPDAACIASSNKEVIIAGGYDTSHQTRYGVTVVSGGMKIKSGKVIADRIVLRSTTIGDT